MRADAIKQLIQHLKKPLPESSDDEYKNISKIVDQIVEKDWYCFWEQVCQLLRQAYRSGES